MESSRLMDSRSGIRAIPKEKRAHESLEALSSEPHRQSKCPVEKTSEWSRAGRLQRPRSIIGCGCILASETTKPADRATTTSSTEAFCRMDAMDSSRSMRANTLMPSAEYGYVNICMITYNRLNFTKQAIQSLLEHTDYPYVLTVVDNGSRDGTPDYLMEMEARGTIKNLVLLENNLGVAKAANIGWVLEPEASHYLKLDNDIVIQKDGWLSQMVAVAERIPQVGVLGYNFEPVSYPVQAINGCRLRVKSEGNVGGACVLIPKRTERQLGYWCEDNGLYGEEDHDYGARVGLTGLWNAYMEDEDVGIHLPGGKAGIIDPVTMSGVDSKESELDPEYREWKDEQRRNVLRPDGPLRRNIQAYLAGERSLYVPRGIFLGRLG